MKKAFLDSDILLDALLKRPMFDLPALNVLALANQSDIIAVTSSLAFMNVHYFLHKYDRQRKISLLKTLRSIVQIVEIGEDEIDMAFNSKFADFEDAVQYQCAMAARADVILTRNTKDYRHSSIPVMTAEQFLKTL
ncbi:MAG: PIN domain-containing protein [Bacteroidetes bacterium]|nr:PIN domain-containing protein [Bacteroidota bacterium]